MLTLSSAGTPPHQRSWPSGQPAGARSDHRTHSGSGDISAHLLAATAPSLSDPAAPIRRLAERYGGTARVTARAGGGAVFTVVLPEALALDDFAEESTPVSPVVSLAASGESR
uniref:hypothetical protein n=1 Tax=Streptomyces blattellae TaxID=2569855 RepID=UPI0038B46714